MSHGTVDEDRSPQSHMLNLIYKIKDRFWFILQILDNIGLDKHYGAMEIEHNVNNKLIIVQQNGNFCAKNLHLILKDLILLYCKVVQ